MTNARNLFSRNQPSLAGVVSIMATMMVLSMGCSKNLTRGRVADLIRSTNFPNMFEYRSCEDGENVNLNGWIEFDQKNFYTLLEKAGWVSIRRRPDVVVGRDVAAVSFTDAGKSLAQSWEHTQDPAWAITSWPGPGDPPKRWRIPIKRKELVEVTGVSNPMQNAAEAEFTWHWVLTKEGKALAGKVSEIRSPALQTLFSVPSTVSGARVQLQLYDDGWRVLTATAQGF